MKTTVKNFERVLYVVNSLGNRTAVCNISDLNKVVTELDVKPNYFTIYEIEGNKLKKVSKKNLTAYFAGQNLKQEFYY